MKNTRRHAKKSAGAMIMALEPRFMFDAAGIATVAETVNDLPPPDGTFCEIATLDSRAMVTANAAPESTAVEITPPAYQEIRPATPDANQGKKEVVFIESNVADVQTLIDGVKPGVEVVVLDAGGDGLAQMAQWAQSHTGYDAIHVISHGAEGQINLGALTLDTAAAISRGDDLATLGAALNETGDLLLYGCSVASGEGEGFISVVAARTGADVAASDDLTGATRLGGDWELEYALGEVSTPIVQRPWVAYDSILAAASDGTYNFSSFSSTGSGASARLTYTHFIATGTLNGTESGIVKDGSIAYGNDNGGAGTGRLIIAADGINTYSFELTGISLNDYNDTSPQYNYKLVGITTAGSTVQSQNTLAAGVSSNGTKDTFDTASFGLANFAGVQLTSFYVEFEVNSGGGTNDMDFNSFTIKDARGPSTVNTTSTVTTGAGSEPSTFATTATTQGGATQLLDFTIADLGSGDTAATTVTALTVNVSGTTTDAERGLMTFLLNGPDATNVTGTYDAGTDKITFSGLNISVADAANETYTVSAYYNDNSSTNDIVEGHTLILRTPTTISPPGPAVRPSPPARTP